MPTAQGFAKARDLYLKESFPRLYAEMEKKGVLKEHLSTVGREAMEMWEDLQAQMMNNPDLPGTYHERVKELEKIPEVVREMVNHEILYARPI